MRAAVLGGVPVEVQEGPDLGVVVGAHCDQGQDLGPSVAPLARRRISPRAQVPKDAAHGLEGGARQPARYRAQQGVLHQVDQPCVESRMALRGIQPHGELSSRADEGDAPVKGAAAVGGVVQHPDRVGVVEGLLPEGRRQDVPAHEVDVVAVPQLAASSEDRFAQVQANRYGPLVSHDPEVLAHPAADVQHPLAGQERGVQPLEVSSSRTVREGIGERDVVDVRCDAGQREPGEKVLGGLGDAVAIPLVPERPSRAAV